MAKISIIVPAHNEEENLSPLVENLQEMLGKVRLDAQIVLVDDNSTDSTPAVCDELAGKHGNLLAIHRKGNPGMGAALKEGTRAASGEIIAWVMADLSDNLDTIPNFIGRIDDGADMVFGSRYIEGGTSGDLDASKRFLSSNFSRVSGFLIGVPVHDITNAFRAFRKEVFLKLDIKSDDFGISPEFALKAHLAGYKLAEVPTSYRNRKRGMAKFRMGKMGVRYLGILANAFSKRCFKPFRR